MTDHFERSWQQLVVIEGGFVDDASDSGGATRYGITEAVARAHGYQGAMRDLPKPLARSIAKDAYWNVMRLDDVAARSLAVAEELFDTGYNMGVGRAGAFLQRSLNVLNREQRDYPDLKVDGVLGQMTVHALDRYIAGRGPQGERVLLRVLNALQGNGYVELAERRAKDEKYVYGWFLNRVAMS